MSEYVDRQDQLAFVQDQMRRYSGQIKRMSGSSMICCPFHADSTPSCHIFHSTSTKYPGSFKCYGCPEKGGWNKLAEHIGLEPYDTKPRERYATRVHIETDAEPIDDPYTTKPLPVGKKWRGIPTDFLTEVGCSLYEPVEYKAKFIFMPVMVNEDMKGFIRGRLRKEKDKPSYVNSKGSWTSIYGYFPFDYAISKAKRFKRVVLVEGQRDALRLLMHGIPALAILGSQSWSDYKANLLELYGIEECILMFDGDPAGIKATKTALGYLKENYKCTVIKLWTLKGNPYPDWKKLSKEERKANKGILWDPGCCPQWVLDKLKDKYF